MTNRLIPQEVTGLDLAFGGDIRKLLPDFGEIPKEFHDWNNKWTQFISDWFYNGISKLDVTPRDGVNRAQALNHIRACMASWAPKHEHKMAGCAYLMSQFFEDEFNYETAK